MLENPEMPIENYVLDYFIIGVIPSLQLRVRETERSHSELFLSFWTERQRSEESHLFFWEIPRGIYPLGMTGWAQDSSFLSAIFGKLSHFSEAKLKIPIS